MGRYCWSRCRTIETLHYLLLSRLSSLDICKPEEVACCRLSIIAVSAGGGLIMIFLRMKFKQKDAKGELTWIKECWDHKD